MATTKSRTASKPRPVAIADTTPPDLLDLYIEELSNEPVATADLARGRHRLTFDFDERLLDGINDHFLMGPVALSEVRPTAAPSRISASEIRSLCGKRLDWVEGVPD